MVGAPRRLTLAIVLGVAALPSAVAFADDEAQAEKKARAARELTLDDVPEPFVPLNPRTSEDRDRIEALELFVSARVLEDQRRLPEAIKLLEKALKKDPESVAILSRLSRLNQSLGRLDEAVEYARRVGRLDPGDTRAIWLLVGYHLQKNDPRAVEGLLKGLLADPKLDPKSPGAVLANRILGDVEAEFFGKTKEAADAYAKVLEALDDRGTGPFSPADAQRIFRGDEAESYLRFGEVFLADKRFEPAVAAFRRGLASDPNHPQIPRLLAQAQLQAGRPAEALAALEPYLSKQPQGREPYESLAEILKALGREAEILPRLEAAAKTDRKNISLQFALAERLRQADRGDEADALLQELLKNQGDPQVFGPLSASLLKERKTDDLVKVIRDAVKKRQPGLDAIRPQIEAIAADPAYAGEVLDAAIRLYEAEPGQFGDEARAAFTFIANKAQKVDQLLALDRLAVRFDPDPQKYRELFADLFRNGHSEEATATLREMFEKYPNERNAQTVGFLSRSLLQAGKVEAALEAAREAGTLAPDDQDNLFLIGYLLGRVGKDREAAEHYQQILARFPNDEDVERQARLGLSAIYVNMEDFDKAEAELELLLERDPDDAGVNNDLGYLYADRGKNLEKAEAMIRKAVEEKPDESAYLDSLGWVLFKRDKPEEARVPLEKAAKSPGGDATILDHLGDVYYRLKEYDKAKESWTKAEESAAHSDPPDKRLASIRKKLEELESLLSSGQGGDVEGPPSDPQS
jgi:tetratricopeptide (TPR) repeat protein